MITNKDISIDSENGKITLNGNKYDLGTQGEIDTAVKGVYSVMGQMSAKNLIPYPYNETTKVDHGVTFTVNNDGTVIANGTANGTGQLYLVLGNVSLSAAGNLVINTNKPLFLSGCPSGGGNTTFRIQYGLTDGTTYWAKTASDTGNGVKITPVDGLNSYCFDVIKIMVFDGYTANNLVFKPMLRLASDTDNTYEPYAMTNKDITDTIGDITQTGVTGADVASQLGALGLSLDKLNLVVHRFYINNAGASLLTDIDVNKAYTTGFIALASSHRTYNTGRISVYLGGVAYRKEDGTVGGIATTRLGSIGAGNGTDGDNVSFSIENDKLKLTTAQYEGATCVTIILSKHV